MSVAVLAFAPGTYLPESRPGRTVPYGPGDRPAATASGGPAVRITGVEVVPFGVERE